jgi:T-complex protein 1 subunit theta
LLLIGSTGLSTASLPTPLTQSSLSTVLKPAIASKQYGDEDILADLIAEAVLTVMPKNPKLFNVDSVRVVKILGGSLFNSRVVPGMVFGREPEGSVKNVSKAKVAVFTSALDIAQTETKGTVLLKNAEEMLNFTTGEEKHLEKASSVHSLPKQTSVIPRRYSKKSQIRVSKWSLPDRLSVN